MSDIEPYLGEIRLFAGSFVPRDWARCEGQLLSRNEHELLFDLIKNTYGGDGVQTFALPDLRGRAPLHQGGTGTGLSPRIIGQQGGVEQVTLSVEQLPKHRHDLCASPLPADTNAPVARSMLAASPDPSRAYVAAPAVPDPAKALATRSVRTSGSSSAHENRMPSLALHFLICLSGAHP